MDERGNVWKGYPWRHHLLFLVPLGLLLFVMFAAPGPENEIPVILEKIHTLYPAFTSFMDTFSDYGNVIYYICYGALLFYAFKSSKKQPLYLVVGYIVCLILSLLLVEGLKTTIGRPRPFVEGDFMPFSDRRSFESFPSGHVAETLLTVTPLVLYWRRLPLTILLGLWPAIMAFSRVYLGHHYPSDVLGSMCVGLCGACAVWYVAKRLALSPQILERCTAWSRRFARRQ